jgi:4-hydroxy-tetrahydrodipicolinate reductase
VHAIRVSDNVGEHTIIFSLMGETLEFTHRAHSRECYARGAVRAAKYLITQKPGLYDMADVLGLRVE